MSSKTLEIIKEQTSITEAAMLRYALSKVSKNRPWYNRSDLSGLCQKAANTLNKKLKSIGLKSQLVFGNYDIEIAGGNGDSPSLPHYWVEVQTKKKTIIADPTSRQFSKYLPQKLLRELPSPLITPTKSKLAKPYLAIQKY